MDNDRRRAIVEAQETSARDSRTAHLAPSERNQLVARISARIARSYAGIDEEGGPFDTEHRHSQATADYRFRREIEADVVGLDRDLSIGE